MKFLDSALENYTDTPKTFIQTNFFSILFSCAVTSLTSIALFSETVNVVARRFQEMGYSYSQVVAAIIAAGKAVMVTQ